MTQEEIARFALMLGEADRVRTMMAEDAEESPTTASHADAPSPPPPRRAGGRPFRRRAAQGAKAAGGRLPRRR